MCWPFRPGSFVSRVYGIGVSVPLPADVLRGAQIELGASGRSGIFLIAGPNAGLGVGLALAYEALAQAQWQPRRAWAGLLAALGAPLGTLAYNTYLALAGLPGMAEIYATKWAVTYAPPWTSVIMAVSSLVTGRSTFQDIVNTMVFVSLTGDDRGEPMEATTDLLALYGGSSGYFLDGLLGQ